jgi:hypothetical protein
MTRIIELYVKERRKMAVGFIAGFGIWQGTRIIDGILSKASLPTTINITLIIIQLLAWGFWLFYLIKMIRVGRVIKNDQKLKEALNDELTRHIRLKAMAAGFWSLIILQILLSISVSFLNIKIGTVLDINIFVAVLSFIISFLFFERETA